MGTKTCFQMQVLQEFFKRLRNIQGYKNEACKMMRIFPKTEYTLPPQTVALLIEMCVYFS